MWYINFVRIYLDYPLDLLPSYPILRTCLFMASIISKILIYNHTIRCCFGLLRGMTQLGEVNVRPPICQHDSTLEFRQQLILLHTSDILSSWGYFLEQGGGPIKPIYRQVLRSNFKSFRNPSNFAGSPFLLCFMG